MRLSVLYKYFFNIFIFAILSGGLTGYMLGVVAGFLPILEQQYSFSTTQISMLAGAILLGCVISSVYTGFLNDYIGRKKVLSATFIIYIVGTLLFTSSDSFTSFYIARLLQGVGFGMAVIVIPIYLSEVSSKEIRGRLVTTFQLSITGGTLLSSLCNILLSFGITMDAILIFLMLLCLLPFAYVVFLPESPRWLFVHSTEEKTKEAINRLWVKFSSFTHWDDISKNEVTEKIKLKELFTNKQYFVSILLVTSIVALAQLSGVNAFIQCGVSLLQQSGADSALLALVSGVAITGINFFATIFTLILVEKLGRVKILKIGSISMVIILVLLAVMNYIPLDVTIKSYLNLIGLVLMVGAFAFGPGGVLLVLCAELVPNKIRGIVFSIAFTIGALVGMFFVSAFLPLSAYLGYSGLFLLIAIFASCYIFIAYKIPETKGKSLEEIENNL